ncbi:MAG: 3-phosphoshikimate 1-carboxyvinyltransferase [SAR324 cluster bacterium]|nr:3-phosphoshikimate 1-carboxyvinyltransferase [SAR324 cluster bacterium]
MQDINQLSKLLIPPAGKIDISLAMPGSKSISNRVLLIAALAKGQSRLHNLLNSVDTKVMLKALKGLGVEYKFFNDQQQSHFLIKGKEGIFDAHQGDINIENSGTAARFLATALNLGAGSDYLLTGNERMKQRPILDLLKALQLNGLKVTSVDKAGYLPLKVVPRPLNGGSIKINGSNSSQYISALMIVAPYAKKDTTIIIEGELVSRGYVEMTQRIMIEFGAKVVFIEKNKILIEAGTTYQGREYIIEADASSASYFLALAAITGGQITIKDITRASLQRDIEFIFLLEKMGCKVLWGEKSVKLIGAQKLLALGNVDMHHISDVAPTLAVVAVFAKGTTNIINVENMRIKECDRISALVTELKKLGVAIKESAKGISITGVSSGLNAKNIDLATYDDHRMAMSFSLLATKIPGVSILDPGCVAKTFPNYFDMLFKAIKSSHKSIPKAI